MDGFKKSGENKLTSSMSEKEEIEGEHEVRKMAWDRGKNTKYVHLNSSS